MNCGSLASSGLATNITWLSLLAITLVAAGIGVLLLTGKLSRPVRATLVTLLLLVTAAFTFTPTPPAQTATSDCSTPSNSLTVTQTSTMENLTPGAASVPITGLVRNNGPDSTRITAVRVEITSVTSSPQAPSGACNASDYVLLEPRMPVEATLNSGGSTPFGGASLGFRNKTNNQDVCKYATVNLLYTVNPAS